MSDSNGCELKRVAIERFAFEQCLLQVGTAPYDFLHVDRGRDLRNGRINEGLMARHFLHSVPQVLSDGRLDDIAAGSSSKGLAHHLGSVVLAQYQDFAGG